MEDKAKKKKKKAGYEAPVVPRPRRRKNKSTTASPSFQPVFVVDSLQGSSFTSPLPGEIGSRQQNYERCLQISRTAPQENKSNSALPTDTASLLQPSSSTFHLQHLIQQKEAHGRLLQCQQMNQKIQQEQLEQQFYRQLLQQHELVHQQPSISLDRQIPQVNSLAELSGFKVRDEPSMKLGGFGVYIEDPYVGQSCNISHLRPNSAAPFPVYSPQYLQPGIKSGGCRGYRADLSEAESCNISHQQLTHEAYIPVSYPQYLQPCMKLGEYGGYLEDFSVGQSCNVSHQQLNHGASFPVSSHHYLQSGMQLGESGGHQEDSCVRQSCNISHGQLNHGAYFPVSSPQFLQPGTKLRVSGVHREGFSVGGSCDMDLNRGAVFPVSSQYLGDPGIKLMVRNEPGMKLGISGAYQKDYTESRSSNNSHQLNCGGCFLVSSPQCLQPGTKSVESRGYQEDFSAGRSCDVSHHQLNPGVFVPVYIPHSDYLQPGMKLGVSGVNREGLSVGGSCNIYHQELNRGAPFSVSYPQYLDQTGIKLLVRGESGTELGVSGDYREDFSRGQNCIISDRQLNVAASTSQYLQVQQGSKLVEPGVYLGPSVGRSCDISRQQQNRGALFPVSSPQYQQSLFPGVSSFPSSIDQSNPNPFSLTGQYVNRPPIITSPSAPFASTPLVVYPKEDNFCISSATTVDHIAHQDTPVAAPQSPTPQPEESMTEKVNHASVPSARRTSATLRPISRLIRELQSSTPHALDSFASDIASADRTTNCILGSTRSTSTSASENDVASATSDDLFISSEPENAGAHGVKRKRSEINRTLQEQIEEVNQKLIDTVVTVVSDEVAESDEEGIIVECSFTPVALSPSLKAKFTSTQLASISPLRLLVPAKSPECFPLLLGKFPVEPVKGCEVLSMKAKSELLLGDFVSIGETARAWGACARKSILEYAEQHGGGSFSSRYGVWSNCIDS